MRTFARAPRAAARPARALAATRRGSGPRTRRASSRTPRQPQGSRTWKLGPQRGSRGLGAAAEAPRLRRRLHRGEVLLRVAARGDDEPEADGRAVVRQRLLRAPARVRGAERGLSGAAGEAAGDALASRRLAIEDCRARTRRREGRRRARRRRARPRTRALRPRRVRGGRTVPPVEARQAGRGRGREDLVLRSAPAHRSDSRRPDMLFRLLRALGRPRGSRGRNAERHAVRFT